MAHCSRAAVTLLAVGACFLLLSMITYRFFEPEGQAGELRLDQMPETKSEFELPCGSDRQSTVTILFKLGSSSDDDLMMCDNLKVEVFFTPSGEIPDGLDKGERPYHEIISYCRLTKAMAIINLNVKGESAQSHYSTWRLKAWINLYKSTRLEDRSSTFAGGCGAIHRDDGYSGYPSGMYRIKTSTNVMVIDPSLIRYDDRPFSPFNIWLLAIAVACFCLSGCVALFSSPKQHAISGGLIGNQMRTLPVQPQMA